jgi:hypothetical protein
MTAIPESLITPGKLPLSLNIPIIIKKQLKTADKDKRGCANAH